MSLSISDRAASPLRVFGAMLRSYRVKAGMSLEQLGARVYLSDDMVGKIENGQRVPTEQFAAACDAVPELNTGGALAELRDLLKDYLKQRAYPGWFIRWPEKEAQATVLRSFELVVIPGLLQTQGYARALLDNQHRQQQRGRRRNRGRPDGTAGHPGPGQAPRTVGGDRGSCAASAGRRPGHHARAAKPFAAGRAPA